MYNKYSKSCDNINDGDISKYDILNSFYKHKNNLYSKLKRYYCNIFDENIFNSTADKKEEELMNILGLKKIDSYLNMDHCSIDYKDNLFKTKQYLHYIALKKYFKNINAYKRIEYFYNIIVFEKILLKKEKKKDQIDFLYKRQSINSMKAFKAGLLLPFDYKKNMSMYGKLFMFIFLSLPAFLSGIISFLVSMTLLIFYSINSAIEEVGKLIISIPRKKIIKKLIKYIIHNSLRLVSKINFIFALAFSKIGDIIYMFLSSFQFFLLKKSKIQNMAYKNKLRYRKIRKKVSILAESENRKKSGFQKTTEEEFDKIIYYLAVIENEGNNPKINDYNDNIIEFDKLA